MAGWSFFEAVDKIIAISYEFLRLLLIKLLDHHNICGRIGDVTLFLVPDEIVFYLVAIRASQKLLKFDVESLIDVATLVQFNLSAEWIGLLRAQNIFLILNLLSVHF